MTSGRRSATDVAAAVRSGQVTARKVLEDHLAATVSGPVERVMLERSYHVATIDYDHEDIERRAVEFVRKVTAS